MRMVLDFLDAIFFTVVLVQVKMEHLRNAGQDLAVGVLVILQRNAVLKGVIWNRYQVLLDGLTRQPVDITIAERR